VAHLLGERRYSQMAQSRAAEFVVLMRVGRHEHFQRPSALAFVFRSSRSRITFQRAPSASCCL